MCLWLIAVKTRGKLCIPQNAHFAFQIFWTTGIVLEGRRNGGASPCCWTGLFWTPCFKRDWCGGSSWCWAGGRSMFIKTRLKFTLHHRDQTVEASLSTWGQSNWAVWTILWSWTLWDYSASGKTVEILKNYLQKFASIKAENTHCAFKDDLSSPRGKITPFNPI